MAEIPTTTRAYTIKLSGQNGWRDLLWRTHLTVNRGAWVWGDWLLTLRGGLPASLANDHPERRVLLALSWLSVESPASLVPQEHVVAKASDPTDQRASQVMTQFRGILDRLEVADPEEWISSCEPALTARIRDDAVWVDRSACFSELQKAYSGLSQDWATNTLFDLLGGEDAYFAMPDDEEAAPVEAKDFVQKAGGWLSRNWGSGEKSDAAAISDKLQLIAAVSIDEIVGQSNGAVLASLVRQFELVEDESLAATDVYKRLKQCIGWKGRSSKGAMALEKLIPDQIVTHDLWQAIQKKLLEEANTQGSKASKSSVKPPWMDSWREQMESKMALPFRAGRDLIWEHGVMLDHALRRVSSAHSWIKRAEIERRQFQADASKKVSDAAAQWLDNFREERSGSTGALGEYIIHKRATDGWGKVVAAWSDLKPDATEQDRIQAARDVQANLDDNEKFGDIQLFEALAAESANCVWHDNNGKPDDQILKDYSAATVAEHNRRRFKVPAYRHPDPLRNPIYVDFGNSRWGISYSALAAVKKQESLAQKLAKTKNEKTREKLLNELASEPDLRGVSLNLWNGESIASVPLHWHGKRLWKDLDLDHFGIPGDKTATRADRLGRAIAGQIEGSVSIAEVFGQKDWNGRLQVPRKQLNRLADLCYAKNAEPDYRCLEPLTENSSGLRQWQHLNWFLTTSAKLRPAGPWLDFVANGLPSGIEYKTGRSGPYLHYDANKDRKKRARLQLSRIAGLRVLSLDLGHRYAAACAVWETLSQASLEKEVHGKTVVAGGLEKDNIFLHVANPTNKIQKSGKRKGQAITETTIYRRTSSDMWARLDRQFLIKLQGEDRPARRATAEEFSSYNEFRKWLGLSTDATATLPRIDKLQADSIRLAQLGLKRLGDAARISYILTARKKPISGGRTVDLNRDERIAYLQDALMLWHGLAKSTTYTDNWAAEKWQELVVPRLGGIDPEALSNELTRPERKKQLGSLRDSFKSAAENLVDRDNTDIHQIWRDQWQKRSDEWQQQLRKLRRLILPRCADWKHNAKLIRHVGGLSLLRLKTIRDLYQLLKAFRMRPEPDDLRKNVPDLGDQSLAKFGRRILNQLEHLREQRIKQLASRVVEAALGVGSENPLHREGSKRPRRNISAPAFAPCHAVIVENLERYRPEETRLRRENRQLMDWAARNVRKYIVEGCQLNGLHFDEVSPAYTSRQDSRTGAPGIRCEDVARSTIKKALDCIQSSSKLSQEWDRDIYWWIREICKVLDTNDADLSPRQHVLKTAVQQIDDLPAAITAIRLPKRGGELFVSSNANSPAANGLQADLNAAANIGLKALLDPDGIMAWWFVLVNTTNGRQDADKTKGCPLWVSDQRLLTPSTSEQETEVNGSGKKTRPKKSKKDKATVYAWNPLFGNTTDWLPTQVYWPAVESAVAGMLCGKLNEPNTPW